MHKFKVGDTVKRIRSNYKDMRVGDTDVITRITPSPLPGLYDVSLREFGTDHALSAFELVACVDDELPPAPESVLYLTERSGPHRQLHVLVHSGLIDIYASDDRGNGKSVVLDPDEVLQLCHDLRRMAMSIKKKDKQDN